MTLSPHSPTAGRSSTSPTTPPSKCEYLLLSLQDSITSQICKFQRAGTKLGPDLNNALTMETVVC